MQPWLAALRYIQDRVAATIKVSASGSPSTQRIPHRCGGLRWGAHATVSTACTVQHYSLISLRPTQQSSSAPTRITPRSQLLLLPNPTEFKQGLAVAQTCCLRAFCRAQLTSGAGRCHSEPLFRHLVAVVAMSKEVTCQGVGKGVDCPQPQSGTLYALKVAVTSASITCFQHVLLNRQVELLWADEPGAQSEA